MGQCCGKEDGNSSAARRRDNNNNNQFNESEYDRDGQSVKHLTKQEDTVTESVPPSPPRNQQQTGTTSTSNSKFSQSPIRSRVLTLEPINQNEDEEHEHLKKHQLASSTSNLAMQDFSQRQLSDVEQQQQNSNNSNNNIQEDQDLMASAEVRANYLKHVNGNQSHAVARVLLEQWCIILNAISKEDEALLTGGGGEGAGGATNAGAAGGVGGVADEDLELDGFGGGGGACLSARGRGGVGVGGGGGKEIYFNQRMFGEGVDVSHSASSTRIEKWATQHATEAVTHESVEEVVQAFLPYLREEIKTFGWGGEFAYEQSGFDTNGVVAVTIKLMRFDGDESAHTYEIVVDYHSISLL